MYGSLYGCDELAAVFGDTALLNGLFDDRLSCAGAGCRSTSGTAESVKWCLGIGLFGRGSCMVAMSCIDGGSNCAMLADDVFPMSQ